MHVLEATQVFSKTQLHEHLLGEHTLSLVFYPKPELQPSPADCMGKHPLHHQNTNSDPPFSSFNCRPLSINKGV